MAKELYEQAWDEICKEFRVPQAKAEKWLEVIKSNHGSPSRFYHNLSHLNNFLAFGNYLGSANYDINQKLAILFHDIIYNPMAKDNEEKSAVLSAKFAYDVYAEYRTQDVYNYILMTKHNSFSYDIAKENKKVAYLLDGDIAILGAGEKDYEKYAISVREEYYHGGVKAEDYRKGRYKFLDNLLKLDRIFHTKKAHEAGFEARARINIKKEMGLYE
jgi:predicted metal-dependent HD superfamily phosphohydrolase